jgi:hypothetical protein
MEHISQPRGDMLKWSQWQGGGGSPAVTALIGAAIYLSPLRDGWPIVACRYTGLLNFPLRVTKRSVSAGYQQEISNVTCRHFSSNHQCCFKVAMFPSSVSLVTVARFRRFVKKCCGEWRLRCFQFPWHGITCDRPSESYIQPAIAPYAVTLTRCHITLSLSLFLCPCCELRGPARSQLQSLVTAGGFVTPQVSSLCLLSERGLDL